MAKKFFWLAVLVIFSNYFDFSQTLIPVIHILPGGRTTNCHLSTNAGNDYDNIRGLIFTFLETAETDFRKISIEEKIISCHLVKGNLSKLIVKAKKDWAPCLDDYTSYLGDFVNDTLQNFLDFFCENDENINGYFTEDAKRCRADIKEPFIDNCLVLLWEKKHRDIKYDLTFSTLHLPGKRDEFCRGLLDVGPCAAELLETHCPLADYYQPLSAKLFAETMKSCDEYVSFISAARIAGITLTVLSILIILVVRFCPVRKWYADFKHKASSKILTNSAI